MKKKDRLEHEHPDAPGEPGNRNREHDQTALRLRELMLSKQLAARDIHAPAVLQAMRRVPRHLFLPGDSLDNAYGDCARPIGDDQTCSQPYIVAQMTQWAELGPHDRVLEIGTGSGYQAAVAAEIAAEVYTIERHSDLAKSARKLLERLEYRNIRFFIGDGYQGLSEHAPFDVILITAGAPQVPPPLLKQLADNGRLVGPIGEEPQQLVRVTRIGRRYETEYGIHVRFVPFVSRHFQG